jgi:hypothetical protein
MIDDLTVGFVMNEDSLSLHPSKTPVTLLPYGKSGFLIFATYTSNSHLVIGHSTNGHWQEHSNHGQMEF